ncbi:hypothetical protein FRC01_009169, partial [Tulasnella sp. 417]
ALMGLEVELATFSSGMVSLKSVFSGGWMYVFPSSVTCRPGRCSSPSCLAHNLSNNSHCYIDSISSPSRTRFVNFVQPLSTPELGFVFVVHVQLRAFVNSERRERCYGFYGSAMAHPPRLFSGGNGPLSAGTSLGLITGGGAETLYSTPPPHSLHLPFVQSQLRNGNGVLRQVSAPGGITPLVAPLPALPHHLLQARQAHHPFLFPTATNKTITAQQLSTNAANVNNNKHDPLLTTLTNILAPSGLRPLPRRDAFGTSARTRRTRSSMFWLDNEPLPTLSRCRPLLPLVFARSANGRGGDVLLLLEEENA